MNSNTSSSLAPIDIFSLAVAIDPQISPDGSKIAYVRRDNDILTDRQVVTVCLLDLDSGATREIMRGGTCPRWSPDSTKLAALLKHDGLVTIVVHCPATNKTNDILRCEHTLASLSWSPDGQTIAFVATISGAQRVPYVKLDPPVGARWADELVVIDEVVFRRDSHGYLDRSGTHLCVVSSQGGAVCQITREDLNVTGPLSWAPGGDTIALCSAKGSDTPFDQNEPTNARICTIKVSTGELSYLTGEDEIAFAPAFSPDGLTLAFLGHRQRELVYNNDELQTLNLRSGARRSHTTKLDRSVECALWSGSTVMIFSYRDHGKMVLARTDMDDALNTLANDLVGSTLALPSSGGSFSVASNQIVAYSGGGVHEPAEVRMVDANGKIRQITHLNSECLSAKSLAPVRKISNKSHEGKPIDAWLATPAWHKPGKRLPTILEIHGGPHAAYGSNFSLDIQLYCAAGFAVLYANPAGSISYGDEFANRLGPFDPQGQYEELMAAVDDVVAEGVADPEQLFVLGSSWGGVMAAWIVGRTQRFKAAVAQAPIVNWTSWILTTDSPTSAWRPWFKTKPWDDPIEYWRRSPLSLVANVKTPTMILVGSRDLSTPACESEQLFTALKMQGVKTSLVLVPDAGHSTLTARPSQHIKRVLAILSWFATYRANGSSREVEQG
jgi:dipeptidyl aminopeptidase/acylaminoacyl peptidase